MELQEAQNVPATAEFIHGADTVARCGAPGGWRNQGRRLAEQNPPILPGRDRRHYLRRPASAATRFPRFRLHARRTRYGQDTQGRQAFWRSAPWTLVIADGAGGSTISPTRGVTWRQSVTASKRLGRPRC